MDIIFAYTKQINNLEFDILFRLFGISTVFKNQKYYLIKILKHKLKIFLRIV